MAELFYQTNSGRHDVNHRLSHGDCLRLRVAVKKNAATMKIDTRAIPSLDCKLSAKDKKVKAVLDIEREAKTANDMPKREYTCLRMWQFEAQYRSTLVIT